MRGECMPLSATLPLLPVAAALGELAELEGGAVMEAALAEALRAKKIAGAGLDVWDKEPPPADHPLLQFDNVIASAHTAGVTREARANMGKIAAEQMLAALDGRPVTRIVNPQVWPDYVKRFERAFGFAPAR